jgi:hypothetical protein
MGSEQNMKTLIFLILCWFIPTSAMADEFGDIRQLAQAFLIRAGVTGDIQDVYLNSLSGGLSNSKNVERLANVAFRIRGQGTRYVQLFQRAGKWQALRVLSSSQLAAAYPQLIEEYSDEYWRETARLEQRMAADLQIRLITDKKIGDVKFVRPRCFVDVNHNTALCDIFYETWMQSDPQCSNTARLFARQKGQWGEVPGKYHSGMRIDPNTGKVFTMIPEHKSGEFCRAKRAPGMIQA